MLGSEETSMSYSNIWLVKSRRFRKLLKHLKELLRLLKSKAYLRLEFMSNSKEVSKLDDNDVLLSL